MPPPPSAYKRINTLCDQPSSPHEVQHPTATTAPQGMSESSTDLYVHPVSDAQPTAQPSTVKSFVDSGNNGLDGVRSCHLEQIGMTRLTSRIQVIPRSVLENAKGFAIFTVFKAGFLFSARAGSGIVIAKLEDGSKSLVFIPSTPHLVYAVALIMGRSTHPHLSRSPGAPHCSTYYRLFSTSDYFKVVRSS